MVITIPFFILLFNLLIFWRVIPDWFIEQYIVLTYASPNLVSMFLSNYAHASVNHMTENMFSYLITIVFILVIALFTVPYFNRKNPGMNCRFGTKTLMQCTLIFFLIAPFIISTESIIAGIFLGKTGGLGFSGIVFAFEGYLVYISEILIIRKIQIVMHKRDKTLMYLGIFLVAMIPMTVIIGQIIMMYTSIFNANYTAHMTGFAIGMITPYLLEKKER
jgi:membrane associated rhomboid family serine protease